MAGIVITEAELLDALAASASGSEPEDARTVQEIMADTGMDVRRTRDALRALQTQGRLVVHQVTRTALDGRNRKVPAYTILPAKKGKRAA